MHPLIRRAAFFLVVFSYTALSGPCPAAEDLVKFTGELKVTHPTSKAKTDNLLFELTDPAAKEANTFQVCDPKAPLAVVLAELNGVQMELQGHYSSSPTQGACFVPEGFHFSAFFGTSYRYVFGSLREKGGKWWIEAPGGTKQALLKPAPGLRQLRNHPALVMAHPDGTTLHFWPWRDGAERFLR